MIARYALNSSDREKVGRHITIYHPYFKTSVVDSCTEYGWLKEQSLQLVNYTSGCLRYVQCTSPAMAMAQSMNPKIVIIGCGMSGIAAAHRLVKRGFCNVRILEATGRSGGRIKTGRMGKWSGAFNLYIQTANLCTKPILHCVHECRRRIPESGVKNRFWACFTLAAYVALKKVLLPLSFMIEASRCGATALQILFKLACSHHTKSPRG